MNDQYRELLRQYLVAVNDLSKYSICHIKSLESRLWEAVRERPGASSDSLHSGKA